MSFIRSINKLQQLDGLIRRKATGCQVEFAKKVGISRSLLNIYLAEMKELGFPVNYCRISKTYYYECEGKMVSSLFDKESLSEVEMAKRTGGANFFESLYFQHCNESLEHIYL